MTDYFDRSFPFVLAREGGYVSAEEAERRHDSGGETNYGICKRDFPDEDIANMTPQRAGEIYRSLYWSSDGIQKSCCDRMPWPLCLAHFDCAVNIGNAYRGKHGEWVWTGNANKILQRALGVDDDGIVGPHTLAVASRSIVEDALSYVAYRKKFYRDLAASNPPKAVNLNGWIARCDELSKYITRHPV